MGELKVKTGASKARIREFMYFLFKDIEALELLIEEGRIEEGVTRIGAEQELSLIDRYFRPAPIADEVLSTLHDPHFTNELAKFNLEINMDPHEFRGSCLSNMEANLLGLLNVLSKALEAHHADYILTGILPTIRSSDLTLENMTPRDRYYALNDAILAMRGRHNNYHISGIDELITSNETVMFESCNTSFQFHYQVGAKDFVDKYNWAQAISGPILSACTNSPLFLGKRLWRESRIALFQQSVDTRATAVEERDKMPRVYFGDRWVLDDILEIFKEDIASHRPLVTADAYVDSLKEVGEGKIPKLGALQLHNGTIYKWNRACYGITNNKPHLRIENRYLPAGPTIRDQFANAAFWVGLMHGMPDSYRGKWHELDFDWFKWNFLNAARSGLAARIIWMDKKKYIAEDLIEQELMPMAMEGLKKAGISGEDIQTYCGVIGERIRSGKTGSQWMLDSYNNMKSSQSLDAMMIAITSGIVTRQKDNKPVSHWEHAGIEEAGGGINRFKRVDQIMSRKLYTVNEDDLIDLVPNIMMWKQIRHLLVENDQGELVGVVTLGRLGRHYAMTRKKGQAMPTVKSIMVRDVTTVRNDSSLKEALEVMLEQKIGSLPVLNKEGKLVGIVTERDFLKVASFYLSELELEARRTLEKNNQG